MARLRFTSPGALLILAIVLAGGIFLLDKAYLSPFIESQKDATLREQASRAESVSRQALIDEIDVLDETCGVLSGNPELASFLDGLTPCDRFPAVAGKAFAATQVSFASLCDESGKPVMAWSKETADSFVLLEKLGTAIAASGDERHGLCMVGGDISMHARRPLQARDEAASVGYIHVGRRLDADVLRRLSSMCGGSTVIVPVASIPGTPSTASTTWVKDENFLMVAWPLTTSGNKVLAYLQIELPATQTQKQASSARRVVLIVLSLSVGLVMLMILGTHMLITGPVIRLLTRLQQLESGNGNVGELARDLHGEPLMLARRLEHAFDKLATISKTDQLTNLSNRRHFEEVLDCFYHQSRRYNRALSVIVMDVDFFKAINDTAGHQAGDEVLKRVAAIIEAACRKADLPARLGGDEFAVLLPETSAHDAFSVAERIRQNVEEMPVDAKTIKLNVSMSIGITDLSSGEINGPGAMISLGDRALYAAKELGRNRCVQAHDLNGLSWKESSEDGSKMDVLCTKLAGLDNKFKGLFVNAVEEVLSILEHRNPHMADHARKVQHFATLIAKEMELPDRVVKRLQVAAMMHDVGMVAMPEDVLMSTKPLDERQLAVMRRHTLLSVRIMERMEFLEQEIPAVRYHHERFDGKGYPEGISGAAIPLSARILAVADTFDAMTSGRSFRQARTVEDALAELKRSAGSQFDPAVVEAFLSAAAKQGDKLMEIQGLSKVSLQHLLTEELMAVV